MALKKYLMISFLIPLISGCTEKPPVDIDPIVQKPIAIQPRPKPVSLNDVKFYVVTEENLDEFITEFKKKNLQLVFVAMSVRDYENISLNVQELRRYIKQQKSIIVYYEESIKTQ